MIKTIIFMEINLIIKNVCSLMCLTVVTSIENDVET